MWKVTGTAEKAVVIRSRTDARLPEIYKLWILRMLVRLNGTNRFLRDGEFRNRLLAEHLGLARWLAPGRTLDSRRVAQELKQILGEVEKDDCPEDLPPALAANLRHLSDLVALTRTEERILSFAVALRSDRLLSLAVDTLDPVNTPEAIRALAAILDIPEIQVRRSLLDEEKLARTCLLKIDRNLPQGLESILDLISATFADRITDARCDPLELFPEVFARASLPRLTLSDYPHMAPQLDVLLPYLKRVLLERRKGVNVFIHGAPGTGKSELARLIAAEMESELYEVSCTDEGGYGLVGGMRLAAYTLAQMICARPRAMILFDEVEDVFAGPTTEPERSPIRLRKGWSNRALEENRTPTLWISNSVGGLDSALVRRFDLVFEVPVPPRTIRERLVRERCGSYLPESAIARIADCAKIAPAVLARAAAVVESVRDDLTSSKAAGAVELLINGTLEAQGHLPVKKSGLPLQADFDPDCCSVSEDLRKVAEGLAATRSGRLCLHGPPGTGKTAFGRWLAELIEAPLLVRRGSDILSRYVGESEQNIAQAFREAERDRAVFLLDEIDGFLQDRRSSHVSWEVTMVNEMLIQIESYSGVLIAATNVMESLDQAALRRFDLKIKFGYLRFDAAWKLLERHCLALGLRRPSNMLCGRLERLGRLTPGDFAAIARRHQFRPIENAPAFLTALAEECALKEKGAGEGIVGFGSQNSQVS